MRTLKIANETRKRVTRRIMVRLRM